jgi:hypothetical protein
MDYRRTLFLLAALLALLPTSGQVHAQYTGAFADGTRFEHATLNGWPEGNPTLRIDAQNRDLGPVFEPKDRLSWMISERPLTAPAPQAFIEFFGGDRFPGQVVGFRYGTEDPVNREAAHLLVEPDSDAVVNTASRIRVRVAPVRKVVWKARTSDRYQPSTVFLLDGKQVVFRDLRWTTEGVTLLLPEAGTVSYSFHQLAEVHTKWQDPWSSYVDTLAHLTPDCSVPLFRVETDPGLIVTTVLSRSQPSKTGHLLQPAWSLDAFSYRPKDLRGWRVFKPQEVPLSIIEPMRTAERVPLQGGRPWQVDRNVKQLELHSNGKRFGHGFGTQANCELEFPLPPWVRGFSTQVGMDRQAGTTGSGVGRILVNSTKETPLWSSKVLVGSGETVASGFVPLVGPTAGQKTLILLAEAVEADKDVAADPLHIRSFVDWLEPRLDLDLDKLKAEVEQQQAQTVAAWTGWTVRSPSSSYRVEARWDIHERNRFHYRPQIIPGASLALSRVVEVADDRSFLLLGLSRELNSPAGRVEVRVDGKPAALWQVPEWQNWNGEVWLAPAPAVVPLHRYRGKSVKIDVEYFPVKEKEPVWWRSLEMVASPDLVRWVPLEVQTGSKAKSPETSLIVEPEQTILVRTNDPRKMPREDTYTIVSETALKEITGFRLELLADNRLPGNGPGRADSWTFLSEFKVQVAPRDHPEQAVEVGLKADATESHWEFPAANAVDGKNETGWLPMPPGRTHVLVCTPTQKISVPQGAILTFTIQQNVTRDGGHAQRSAGRFRLMATDSRQPLAVARPGIVLEPPGRRTIFEDEFDFLQQLRQGGGKISFETKDKYSGEGAIKLVGQRFDHEVLGAIRIRKEPALGEYRYMQWAWKKPDGQAIGIQLSRDKGWGPMQPMGPTFRYHAGPNKPWGNDSLPLTDKLPTDWVVVTRDLAQDCGEFTLTGLSLDGFDGTFALFDHIRLGRTLQDLEGE